ncbi:MAG: phospholipase [Acidobacteria bacterium]|nr:MAG: phospholipase [Acidobacteriota bacterium]REK05961.1 MAG: phospholipase [Acidobacteriota bacterium]
MEPGVAAEAGLALLLVHGRGGSAEDALELGRALRRLLPTGARGESSPLYAPQAEAASWYPSSFLAPPERNQPWLRGALELLRRSSARLEGLGFPRRRQIVAGFSQGACLACELVGREGGRWGGLVAFTGALPGPLDEPLSGYGPPDPEVEQPWLDGTPVLLSSGDPDPHVPFSRVRETASLLERLGAAVTVDRYPGRPHTVLAAELQRAAQVLSV